MTEFAGPDEGIPAGDFFDPRDHNGRVLILTPKTTKTVDNKFPNKTHPGPTKDVVVADVVVLAEGDKPTAEYSDSLLFSSGLEWQTKALIGTGKSRLGRLGKAKIGQGEGWQLATHTDADVALAKAWKSANQSAPF